jgi:hypothetical protein
MVEAIIAALDPIELLIDSWLHYDTVLQLTLLEVYDVTNLATDLR